MQKLEWGCNWVGSQEIIRTEQSTMAASLLCLREVPGSLCPKALCGNNDSCKYLCEKAALSFWTSAKQPSFSPYESGSPETCLELEFRAIESLYLPPD